MVYGNELMGKVRDYMTERDARRVERAMIFAAKAHFGQKRKSGSDYITHPLQVANILVDAKFDVETVCGGLLHDVVEDTKYTKEDIEKRFGIIISKLVDGVTKLNKVPYYSKDEQQVENLRKMFFAIAEDPRVVLIKLADRLHNMRTIRYIDENKRRLICRETIEIHAAIAHRLGMFDVKSELEDLALKFIDPLNFYEISDKIFKKGPETRIFREQITDVIKKNLKEAGIKCEVDGRVKNVYSIWRKMFMQNKSFEEIYDVFAVRIIVGTVSECYISLGIIHKIFTPIPGRLKDYIATPKENSYQSIHTTVTTSNGILFEVQIRTEEMHKAAELGVAAHWRYKAGGRFRQRRGKASDFDTRIGWIRHFLDSQKDARDFDEFSSILKNNMTGNRVYAFTPKGEVNEFPLGSTAIDFAYKIHTMVGNKMIGCVVNGETEPIDYVLKSGDFVKILTDSDASGPTKKWLELARTANAKDEIAKWLKENDSTFEADEDEEESASEIKNCKYNYLKVDCGGSAKYFSHITIIADNGHNILHEITDQIRDCGARFEDLEAKVSEENIKITFELKAKKLKKIITAIDNFYTFPYVKSIKTENTMPNVD